MVHPLVSESLLKTPIQFVKKATTGTALTGLELGPVPEPLAALTS